MPHTQSPTSQHDELHKEEFNILPSTVNAKCGAGIKHLSRLSQNIPVMGKAFLRMNWLRKQHGAHIIAAMCTLCMAKNRGLTSTPLKPQVKIEEDNTLLHPQERASVNTLNPTMNPPRYEMMMVVQ